MRFEAMLEGVRGSGEGDVFVIHGCCHNPTGADLSADQWQRLATALKSCGATPLVDLAYLGFAHGLEEDAQGLRTLACELDEVLVASSYSKNFALYRERVGALSLVAAPAADASSLVRHAQQLIRANYSMPPDHGAAVVAHVLTDPALRPLWVRELDSMRRRVVAMRQQFAALTEGCTGVSAEAMTRQTGMFVSLPLAPEQVKRLGEKHHVHVAGSGRMNVAGLTSSNIGHVAEALVDVMR